MQINLEKWSVLALTRFMLASIVAVNHLAEYTPLRGLRIVPKFGAFEAVLGFLVVSGYSIGYSYTKQPDGFLKRRAMRIYPIYIGAMLLTYIAVPEPLNASFGATIVQNLLFLNQFTTHTSYVGPAWSLSLEFWLYSLTPLIARLAPTQMRGLIYVSFAAYCCNELGRTMFHWPYYSGVAYGENLLFLSYAWLSGFAMTRDFESGQTMLRVCRGVLALHLAITMAIQFAHRVKHDAVAQYFSDDMPDYLARGTTLFVVWIVFKALVEHKTGAHRSTTLRLLGDISYPLYLVHIPVFMLAARYGLHNAYLMAVVSVLASYALYYCVDLYSRRRKEPVEVYTNQGAG